MGDVASHGRTIIFVSHNMTAVQSLCKSAIYLRSGRLADMGRTDKVINNYLSKEVMNCMLREWEPEEAPGNEFIKLVSAKVVPSLKNDTDAITIATRLVLRIEFINYTDSEINLSLFLNTTVGNCIFNLCTNPEDLGKGKKYTSELEIPANFLNDDIYTVNLLFVKDTSKVVFSINDILTFEVFDEQREGNWYGKWPGAVRPDLKFTLT
jgi:lipopolysaccharide transport system ATP-binding protein